MTIGISALVPRIIMEHDREKPWKKWLEGSVLFADVSGFTPMSEALAFLGAEGAELLTDILNTYFREMIGIITDYGGEVMKFGGDAILCFFPGRDALPACIFAASLMQAAMKRFTHIKTPIKSFELKMKIGIAHGDVLFAVAGNPVVRCDYVFAGKPVDLTSEAEHHAQAGDIILACSESDLDGSGLEVRLVEEGFYRVDTAPPVAPNKREPGPLATDVGPFIISEIRELLSQGYDRFIGTLQGTVPVFLSFTGFSYTREEFELDVFDAFFTLIMDITQRYHGRLNRINMGDKGSTFFILFGAPTPLEQKEELACIWSLEVMSQVRKKFPTIILRIGLNSGRIFSGLVGGHGRFDYTIMGDTVNFSARLMQGAQDFQVCVSESIKQKAGEKYECEFLGNRKFKGKHDTLPVYALKNRKLSFDMKRSTEEFFGRENEVKILMDNLDKARKGRPCMTVIQGVPGIGKSFLANHLLGNALQKKWSIEVGRGDISLKSHPYAPWQACLTSLFFPNRKPVLDDIKSLLLDIEPQFVDNLARHADFFGVEHALATVGYDDETAKKLFHHQISTLVLDKINITPTLIFLDDLHWFDSLSLELLITLLEHFKDQQMLLLCTTRPEWQNQNFLDRESCQIIELEAMDKVSLNNLAEKMLEGRIRSDLLDLLISQAQGNPFFTLNLLLYLQEHEFLEKRLGLWVLKKDAVIEKTISNDEIVLTQLNQFSPEQTIHIRYATCIGTSFNVRIMMKAMGREFRKTVWQQLLDSNFFMVMSKDVFSFQHALLQDTIYHSIPKKERTRTHKRIGRTIETLFSHDLKPWLPHIANHYFLAEVGHKAIEYCIQAGAQLFQQLSFNEAVTFYTKAYELLLKTNDNQKWTIGLLLAENHIRLGKIDASLELVRHLLSQPAVQKDKGLLTKVHLLEFDALSHINDFSYLDRAWAIVRELEHSDNGLIRQVYYYIGVAHLRQASLEDARLYFQKILDSQEQDRASDDPTILKAITYLGDVARKMGQTDQALTIINRGIQRARASKMVYQEMKLQIAKAQIMIEASHTEQSRQLLLDLIPQCEKIGDIYLLASVLLNLGTLEYNLHHFEEAKAYLREAINLFERSGTLNGKAKALNALGGIAFFQKDYPTAQILYFEALKFTVKLGEKWEIAELYYNLSEVSYILKQYYAEQCKEYLDQFKQSITSLNNPYFQQAAKQLEAMISENEGRENEI